MAAYDVFISYSRVDQAITARIAETLRAAGITVWMDHDSIESPDRWDQQIANAIEASAHVLVIISPESHVSSQQDDDIVYAADMQKVIIPVLVRNAQPTDIPLRLRTVQFLDLRNPAAFEHALSSLIDDLRARPSASAPEPKSEVAPPPPPASPAPPAPQEAPAPGGDMSAQPIREAAEPEPEESFRKREARHEPDILSTNTYDRVGAPPQPPEFTAYYPAAVKPASPYALMVFVHLEAFRAQVEEIAQGYAAMMGGSQTSAGVSSAINVNVGSLITFVPVIEGITFDAPERAINWQPPHQSATFLFTTPENLPQTLTGRIHVYQGPLIIGEIPVSMQVVAADQPISTTPSKSAEMERLQPVFASYSHRDTPVMEYFRRSYERLGQKMLVDVYDLRSGEHWADRLLDMIGESAIFQLFWSDHSARSDYCRQEWEHALRFIGERPRFIRPVWWQEPMPAPPPELADLHFQRVPIPVLTRMQVVMAKVRGFFS